MKKRLTRAFWLVGSGGAVVWTCFWLATFIYTLAHTRTYSFNTLKTLAIPLLFSALGVELARQGFRTYLEAKDPTTRIHMLCRNRVRDYVSWKAAIDSHAKAQRAAGLHMAGMWRSVEDANNIFFLFEIESMEKARAFISAPEATEVAEASGVFDGEYHFIETVL